MNKKITITVLILLVLFLGGYIILKESKNSDEVTRSQEIKKDILIEKNNEKKVEEVIIKEKKTSSKKEEKVILETNKEILGQKVIKGYDKVYEYISKNDMKQIVEGDHFTKDDVLFNIYSDGEYAKEGEVTPPNAPVDVSIKIGNETVRFFVPSNATQAALLVTNEDENSAIIKPLEEKNSEMTSPPTPEVLFSSEDSKEEMPPDQGISIE